MRGVGDFVEDGYHAVCEPFYKSSLGAKARSKRKEELEI
jgi:hypothetical protein